MLHVIAIITTKPGKRDAVLAEFTKNAVTVREEAGCIQYFPVVDAKGSPDMATPLGPDSFMVIEEWESQATLAAHAASPHMASYGAKVKDMLAGRAVHVLDPV